MVETKKRNSNIPELLYVDISTEQIWNRSMKT